MFLRLFLTFSTALANLRDLLNFLERIRAALYRVRNITLGHLPARTDNLLTVHD